MQDAHWKDETDFRDFLKHPRKLFGYSTLYLMGTLLVLGMLYLWNISVVGRNAVEPAALSDSTAFVQDIPMQSPAVLPPVDVMKAGIASDSLVARGRDLYRANCSSCHGDEGRGEGPSSLTLKVKPRNFRSLGGWTNGSKVSEIYKTLQEGIVRNGMAAYNYLPPGDRFALAHYVRTFAPGQPVDSPDDLQKLETAYQLSKGSRSAGQIPVKKALRLVLAEQEPVSAQMAGVLASASGSSDPAVQFLLRYCENPARAIVGLKGRKQGLPQPEELSRMVSADPSAFGFKPSVTRLTASDWKIIHVALASLSAA